ncbi:MAG: GNAT family N-acetyltransferase [Pseudomonadota bacterium]
MADLEPMTADHLDAAAALSTAEEWPHRPADWDFLFALGRGFVAVERGAVVGTVSWWPFGAFDASIGMLVVRRSGRGRGLGRRLMDRVATAAGGRRLHLVATADGLPLYERLGFRVSGTVVKHEGLARAPAHGGTTDVGVREFTAGDLADVVALDRAACGMDRSALLRALVVTADVRVSRAGGDVAGYGVCRASGRDLVIGPVVGRAEMDARALVSALLTTAAGRFVRIDVPQATGLSGWLQGVGLEAVSQATTMVQSPSPLPPTGPAKRWALANQALG